jgi:hypothetical protein
MTTERIESDRIEREREERVNLQMQRDSERMINVHIFPLVVDFLVGFPRAIGKAWRGPSKPAAPSPQ